MQVCNGRSYRSQDAYKILRRAMRRWGFQPGRILISSRISTHSSLKMRKVKERGS